jgi:hypothetical protein
MILKLMHNGISFPPIMEEVFVMLQVAQKSGMQTEQVINNVLISKY